MQQYSLTDTGIKLHQGDCREVLTSYSKTFDTIFTDPPYNTGKKKSRRMTYTTNAALEDKNWNDFHAEWDASWESRDDYETWTLEWMEAARDSLDSNGSMWVCGTHHCIPEIIRSGSKLGMYLINEVIWELTDAMPNLAAYNMTSCHQTLVWFRKRKGSKNPYRYDIAKVYSERGVNLRDVWRMSKHTDASIPHPSPKPIPLIERALAISTPDGATVCDPFAGSGQTAMACNLLTSVHRCVLIDREEAYVTYMANRFHMESKEGDTWQTSNW